MERDAQYFIATIILLLLCFSGFAYYHHTTIMNVRSDMDQSNKELTKTVLETRGQLENSLFILDQKVDLKTKALEQVDEQFHSRLVGAAQDIQTVQKEAQSSISQISQKSEQLESDLLSMNVQTKDFSVIISRVIDSVVSVRTEKGVGSGALVDKRGFIITNKHVIDGASAAAVVTYDKKVHPVQLVATSDDYDLAVLKIGNDQPQFSKFKFAADSTLRVGQKVTALGSPGGLDFTVTEGIVSSLLRTNNKGAEFLQTDVSINPGNSGGPLINIEGRIVGINTMKKQDFEGIGFAIKADQVKDFVEEVIKQYDGQE